MVSKKNTPDFIKEKSQLKQLHYTNASQNDITVVTIKKVNSKTVEISGMARGYWFFEASFPIEIKDGKGIIIGSGIGTAEAEWMTTELIPYKATLALKTEYSGIATIALKKDNPSGDPERDASLEYQIDL
jgi:hypothetical protein